MSTGKRAFTIVELMVVMIIIAVVASILIPALGHVRGAARDASTRGLLNDIVQAASKFEQDNRRHPGYFGAHDMGDSVNEDVRGMSEAENVMLDLAGGIVGTGASGPTGSIEVGPFGAGSGQNVWADPTRVGMQGTYFVPPPKFYVAQPQPQQVGEPGHTGAEGAVQLADMVDAHGQPILIWREDEAAMAVPVLPPNRTLALHHATTNTSARFYWATNAAFLKSDTLGKKGRNQNCVSVDVQHSIIGGGTLPEPQVEETLEALLGNPNFPWVDPANPNGAPQYASAGRSGFIVQSAGRDGFYFGSKDKGAKRIEFPLAGDRAFTAHFMPPGANWPNDRFTDKNGNVTVDDLFTDFDDIVATSSN